MDLKTHKTTSGTDFYTINSKGNVPAIVLDNGQVLNENVATLLWIADQSKGKVGPAHGTDEWYQLVGALAFIASEVHPSIGGLFHPGHNDGSKEFNAGLITKRLGHVENTLLKDKDFLVGGRLSVADLYLYIVLSWTQYVGVDLAPYPRARAYADKIKNLPQVAAAFARIATNPATTI